MLAGQKPVSLIGINSSSISMHFAIKTADLHLLVRQLKVAGHQDVTVYIHQQSHSAG